MTSGNDWFLTAWTQTWQVTVLIAAIALLVRLAAANRPQLAFVLWLVVLVKCVTPPLWSSPSGAFCWLQPPRACGDVVHGDGGGCRNETLQNAKHSPDNLLRPPAARQDATEFSGGSFTTPKGRGSPSSGQRPGDIGLAARVLSAQRANPSVNSWPVGPTGEQEDPLRSSGRCPGLGERQGLRPIEPLPKRFVAPAFIMPRPATLLASIWLSGMIAVFCLTAWRRVRFARLLRRANRVENPACERILASLRHRLRLRGRVRLIVTERLIGPAVFGLLRPTVLLPQAVIESKSDAELELILAHELIHIRRGDLWFGLLRSVVELVWWFHPLVWWAARRASREAERCCDEAVLAELQCGPASYARCLLDVLEAKHQLRCVPACPGVRAVEVTQARLERIMKIGEKGHKRTPWWCWAIAIVAAAAVVPGAAIGTSSDKTNTSPLPLGEGQGVRAAVPEATKAATPTLAPRADDGDEIDRMLKRKPTAPTFAADSPAKEAPTLRRRAPWTP